MKIRQVTFRDCWGAGEAPVVVDLADHTVVIGPNNVGKSNILKCASWLASVVVLSHAPAGINTGFPAFAPSRDTEGRRKNAKPHASISVELEQDDIGNAFRWPKLSTQSDQQLLRRCVLSSITASVSETGGSAGQLTCTTTAKETRELIQELCETPNVSYAEFDSAVSQARNNLFGTVQNLLRTRVRRTTSWRKVSAEIAKQLLEWQGADADHPEWHVKFDRVRYLLREWCEEPDLELRPVHDKQSITLKWQGVLLPLENFGDGIAQLLLIAYFIVTTPGLIALLEEPELGLHPAAQRRVLRSLCGSTVSQFVATTHSSVFLDQGAGQSIVRASRKGGIPEIMPGVDQRSLYALLDEIGARPSDLLQANVAVWVEGPSDRIFLRRCIELVDPELQEGIHYQFAIYGGRLGTYLGVEDHDEQINLLRLCRHVVVVADSDRAAEHAAISAWKSKLGTSLAGAGGLWWVTAGREIENYLHPSLISQMYSDWWGHPCVCQLSQWDQFGSQLLPNAPEDVAVASKDYANHKVAHMRRLAERMAVEHLDVLDLHARVDELVAAIRGWQ